MTTDKKPENVKIPLSLFIDLYMYFRLPPEGREKRPDLESRIRNQLNDRFDKWYNHTIFSAYRTAESEADREKFLSQYLERTGIPDELRQLLRQDQPDE